MNIFDDLSGGKSVFKTKIFRSSFLPDKLPHREKQIKSIAKYWKEALDGVTPPNITIYGKTGTGKPL